MHADYFPVNSDPVSVYYILIVYLRFVQRRTMGVSMSGPIVIEKASQFHTKLHPDDEDGFTVVQGGCGGFATVMELDSSHYKERSCQLMLLLQIHLRIHCWNILRRKG